MLSGFVPGTNGTNGDKKARLDPACGTLVFCGATDFANMLKPGKLKEVRLKNFRTSKIL